jgi:hypothetical protein
MKAVLESVGNAGGEVFGFGGFGFPVFGAMGCL